MAQRRDGIASDRLEGASMAMAALPMPGPFLEEGHLKATGELQDPHWSREQTWGGCPRSHLEQQ